MKSGKRGIFIQLKSGKRGFPRRGYTFRTIAYGGFTFIYSQERPPVKSRRVCSLNVYERENLLCSRGDRIFATSREMLSSRIKFLHISREIEEGRGEGRLACVCMCVYVLVLRFARSYI